MLRSLSRNGLTRKAVYRVLPSTTQVTNRGFAGESDEHVSIPTQVHGVGGKYASALYVSATRANALGPVEAELKQLLELARKNQGFADFLKDPSVPKSTRISAIEDIFGEAGFTDITKHFLAVLAEGGRLSYLPKAAEAYADLLRAHRGEVKATITAALELSPSEVAEITEALKGFLKKGQTLSVDQKVDLSIIGGLVIDIGENHIDLSIDSKIKQLEKVLAGAL